jgi:hypothetical protein
MALSLSCGAGSNAAQQGKQETVLAPPANATNVQYGNENAGSVSFDVPEGFPADTMVRDLRQRLRSLGWRESSEDVLIPLAMVASSSHPACRWHPLSERIEHVMRMMREGEDGEPESDRAC